MYMSVDAYIKRLQAALENDIAPAIVDDKVRGQVFAIVNLLDQLATRVEYKLSLINEDVQKNTEAAREVSDSLVAAGVDVPPELQSLLERSDSAESFDMALHADSEKALAMAIELFFAYRHIYSLEAAREVDRRIRDHLTKVATRDIGLTKPPNFDKISRSHREAKPSEKLKDT